MSEWRQTTIDQITKYCNKKQKQLKTSNYFNSGNYPVIDQSEKFVTAYSDREELVYEGKLPVTVFGDHTRYVKFIDFDFIAGADGTQLLRPSSDLLADKYYYYLIYFWSSRIGNYGYDRHLKHLKRQIVKHPVNILLQNKIANILTTIDKVIEQTENAIEKLKKIKQGMMHDLFTRGIDIKTGKLRPPYTEAPKLYKETELGWIPKDWDIVYLGDDEKFELRTGGTPSTARLEYWGGDIPWMSSGEVHKKRVYYVDNTISELGYKNSNAYLYPVNTIIIALAGQGKTRGTVALTYIETTSNQSIVGIICKKGNPSFFYFLLDSQYGKLRSVSAGAGRAGLSIGILAKYFVFYPAIAEQKYISEKLESIDKKINNEMKYLRKKRLLKQGLMQDLLTGKVEVTPDPQDKEYQEVS